MKIFAISILLISAQLLSAQIFNEVPETPFKPLVYSSVDFADIDLDNDLDVLISGRGDEWDDYHMDIYLNEGDGKFIDSEIPLINIGRGDVKFFDFNGDTYPDFIASGGNVELGPVTNLNINDGSGGFIEKIDQFIPIFDSSIAISDVNSDGFSDVFMIGVVPQEGPFSYLYMNDGNGNFTLNTESVIEGLECSDCAFGDVDNDGDEDLVITGTCYFTGPEPGVTKLYLNDGNGFFQEDTNFDVLQGLNGTADFLDANNDGNLDVLITGGVPLNIPPVAYGNLYLNDGTGKFEEVIPSPFSGTFIGAVKIADINNDSFDDVIACRGATTGSEFSEIYLNNGEGKFDLFEEHEVFGISHGTVESEDLNNDGLIDILVSGSNVGSSISKLYMNEDSSLLKPQIEVPKNFEYVNHQSREGIIPISKLTVSGVLFLQTNTYWNDHRNRIQIGTFQNGIDSIYDLNFEAQKFKVLQNTDSNFSICLYDLFDYDIPIPGCAIIKYVDEVVTVEEIFIPNEFDFSDENILAIAIDSNGHYFAESFSGFMKIVDGEISEEFDLNTNVYHLMNNDEGEIYGLVGEWGSFQISHFDGNNFQNIRSSDNFSEHIVVNGYHYLLFEQKLIQFTSDFKQELNAWTLPPNVSLSNMEILDDQILIVTHDNQKSTLYNLKPDGSLESMYEYFSKDEQYNGVHFLSDSNFLFRGNRNGVSFFRNVHLNDTYEYETCDISIDSYTITTGEKDTVDVFVNGKDTIYNVYQNYIAEATIRNNGPKVITHAELYSDELGSMFLYGKQVFKFSILDSLSQGEERTFIGEDFKPPSYLHDHTSNSNLNVLGGNFRFNSNDAGVIQVEFISEVKDLRSNIIDIVVYPNPTNDKLQIHSNQRFNKVEVFDQYGNLMIFKIDSKGIESLDVSQFPSGYYYLRLWDHKESGVVPFIKN